MCLWLGLPNMIIDSVSRGVGIRWLGGSVHGWLVGRWSVDLIKPQKKHIWSGDFTCAIWSRFILLFYLFLFISLLLLFILFFLDIDNKEKTNLIARSSHSNL